MLLLLESLLAALATLTILVMARLIDHLLRDLLGSSITGFIWIAALVGALGTACLLVAGLSLITDLGERNPLARATVLITAALHLVIGLGQARDVVAGTAATPAVTIGLVLTTVFLMLVAGALVREWWRMQTTPDRKIVPPRTDR